jgi:hypothetical protein
MSTKFHFDLGGSAAFAGADSAAEGSATEDGAPSCCVLESGFPSVVCRALPSLVPLVAVISVDGAVVDGAVAIVVVVMVVVVFAPAALLLVAAAVDVFVVEASVAVVLLWF